MVGIGITIEPNKLKKITKDNINERIMEIKIKLIEQEIWTITIANVKDEDTKKEDKFFALLQKTIYDGEGNIMNGRYKWMGRKRKFRYEGNTGERR